MKKLIRTVNEFGEEYMEEIGKNGMRVAYPRGQIYQGRPRRTKFSHPYSYDPFVYWRRPGATHVNGEAYSDRMWSWWGEKMHAASKRIFTVNNEYGQKVWDRENDPDFKGTEQLLSEMLTDDKEIAEALKEGRMPKLKRIQLVRIDEYCNVSNGYPVWHLIWLDLDDPKRYKLKSLGE